MEERRKMHGKRRGNKKLSDARLHRNWSQQRLASELETSQTNISRWEKGTAVPNYYFREQLCKLFGTTMEDLGFFQDNSEEKGIQPFYEEEKPGVQEERDLQSVKVSEIQQGDPIDVRKPSVPKYWLVPYERNLYFTDREEILKDFPAAFFNDETSIPVYAISGLPGVGKTQIAIEYAYRYMEYYQAVFWLRADNTENLILDFVDIAYVLNLPEKSSNNQTAILHAVQQWLTHNSNWLLIFDNVERLELVTRFFPVQSHGHIILTMRAEAVGKPAIKIAINPLEIEEGATFLLRRMSTIQQDNAIEAVTTTYQEQARALSIEMDGLPLALDQAGAYVEELSCTLSEYLTLYHDHRKMLLARRGDRTYGHPDSIVTSITIALEKIKELNPASVELLYLYAFLHPDSIPKTILRKDIPDLSFQLQTIANDPFLLNETIGLLSRYSLIRSIPRSSGIVCFRMHRLVQDVLKDLIEEEGKRQWAKQTIRVVNSTLSSLYFAEWSSYHQYVSHAQVCVTLIEDWEIVSKEAAQLLSWIATYNMEQGRYSEVEVLIQQSLSILSKIPEASQTDVLENVSGLASLYLDQGKYDDATKLYQQILAALEQEHGELNLVLRATIYNNLGELYDATGQYEQAEEKLIQALNIREHIFGSAHEFVAISLYCLANLYSKQGRYRQAEQHFQRSLEIREQKLEKNHGNIAESLNGQAANLVNQQRYDEAEPLLLQALEIRKKVFGPDHPSIAQTLNNLANNCMGQQKLGEAKSYFQRALQMNEKVLGKEHRDVADSLVGLALINFMQNQVGEANLLLEKALSIRIKALGSNHPDTVKLLQMKEMLRLI